MVSLATIIGVLDKPLALQLYGEVLGALINRGDLSDTEKSQLTQNHSDLEVLKKHEQEIVDGKDDGA